MYDRLLLPTDMSPGVDRAIDHATDAATRYDAELHVLYVVDADAYSSYPGDEYVHEFEGLESALENAGRDAVDEIAEQAAAADVSTVTEIRHGVPHEEILTYAEDAAVGLTVVGSKHRSDEYRRLLGSVAERVAHMAERPVTIVKTPVNTE
ncbi:universal stress protein [Natrarchaeobaculum sulfurireducens]|uniref:Nucleotide-binding protein, UspA family n=1 Tax=Natrarchaeobaculum sulfurireducens TaxID=2044521 RepID=A0A346PD38_9EURY|nr:universal stress protein [Natrarchaeobaculum sulfurireducens]AXR77433.1 Nucleotide-binding protein, UspA family [Natrarchaeobaculum sulfurireducens]